ncbi:tetraacyldisaccharide 4'-kinase [Massilia sp. DJPM01]|uniref:tetraacyldisaccharide 4'-kinase n=1 Tax=Massilia sp. DJPM01 TaxID=3024404 RepID=UPI00259E6D64|nr:tetraacyldisaccharide 4'-kinase [Massilia sp. DJPM01]MDM5178769.1 tetraacyldisaccharide 4'-kinase [Massilia sp. DJPM01]
MASSSSSSLATTLQRAWQRRGALACALWPLSLLFRCVSGLRALLFRCGVLGSTRLPVPVIVVGNIFIGGTGKTPLTIWLAEALRGAGFTPGIISRGHGGADSAPHSAPHSASHSAPHSASHSAPHSASRSAPRAVTADSSARDVGDEPLLIARRTGCPVVVGRDRGAAGRALLAAHPDVDVILTDDGLQHYALRRDIEIMLFDGRGVGNGWLLPAGPLREAPSRRRDFTIVNAPELTPALRQAVGGQPFRMQLAGEFAEPLARPGQRVPLASLAGRRLVAACGIGNPQRFFTLLRGAGLEVLELPLPDHHDFRDQPFAAIEADCILITEKDAVKCAQIENLKNDPRLWVVPVTAQLDSALAEHIVEKCRGCSTA